MASTWTATPVASSQPRTGLTAAAGHKPLAENGDPESRRQILQWQKLRPSEGGPVTASATLPQKHCTSTDASLASSAAMALAVRGLMRFAKAGREVYKPRLDCKSSDVQILLNATIYVH